MKVAGVDGCRVGWVVAVTDGRTFDVVVMSEFAAVVELLNDGVEAIAVDMPIGLPEAGPRRCDIDARKLLGARRSTVFPTPPRALLHERDYPTALRTKRALDGKGLSKQAFFLLPKMAEVDACLGPHLQDRIVEAHPELAFQALARRELPSKHTHEGLAQRERLVSGLTGGRTLPDLAGTRPDDVLDAIVLTATAKRLAIGTAEHLGDGRRDGRGLLMEIVF